jgi:transcriptional regulator with XRE-family HTH domain
MKNSEKNHDYMCVRLKKFRETLNKTVPQIVEEMEALGFKITYVTINNYEKSLKKGVSLDLLQYYMLKGLNIKFLLKEDNSNEPIYDKDIKEPGELFIEKEKLRYIYEILRTLLEEIGLFPEKKKVERVEKVIKVEKADILDKIDKGEDLDWVLTNKNADAKKNRTSMTITATSFATIKRITAIAGDVPGYMVLDNILREFVKINSKELKKRESKLENKAYE